MRCPYCGCTFNIGQTKYHQREFCMKPFVETKGEEQD